jgi:serine phosphatase RsbU (regulator of sigma subunit)
MSERPTSDHVHEELVEGLGELTVHAREGVPGCVGVSISVLGDGVVGTLAATDERIRRLDEDQYRADDGPCVAAIRRRENVTVVDYRTDERWPTLAADAVRVGIRSSHSVPLTDPTSGVLGGLNLYADAPDAFEADSRRLAEVFARQAGVLLGYIERLHSERAARLREHDLAATLQHSLLPTLPEVEGITCASRYLVSEKQAQVGGDWYDLFALPDGSIGVAIGDVMGHDVAAAAAMGQLRSVLRSYAYEGSGPSGVLERLDRLVQDFDMAQVATAMFGRLELDPNGATLVFANAGHLPPVIRRPDGKVLRIDQGSSPLIGVLPPGGPPRGEAFLTLPKGSILVLYTDGLVENRARDYEAGVDELCAVLAATDPGCGPEELCEAIVSAMGGTWEDDVALLAVGIGVR